MARIMQTVKLNRFDGGINDFVSPQLIQASEAPLSVNNELDKPGVLSKAVGYALSGTAGTSGTIRGLGVFEKSDGTTTRIKAHGTSLKAFTTDWSASIKTTVAGNRIHMVNAFLDDEDRIYFSNEFNEVIWSYDGTNIEAVTDVYAKCIEYYKNRLYCANVKVGSTINPERVIYSGLGNDLFAVTNSATPYDYFDDVGRPILALKTYGDYLCIFTANRLFVYDGYNLRGISGNYGTINQDCVQIVEGRLIWLNRQGVYMWAGSGLPTLISRKIQGIVNSITTIANARGYIDHKGRYTVNLGTLTYNGTSYTNLNIAYDVINNNWSIFDGRNVACGCVDASTGQNVYLIGDATDDKVFVLGSGTSNAGTAIASLYQTPYIVVSENPEDVRNFYKIHLTYKPQNVSEYITVKYRVDGVGSFLQIGGTDDNFSLAGTANIVTNRVELPANVQGHYIELQLSHSSSTASFEIYEIKVEFDNIGNN